MGEFMSGYEFNEAQSKIIKGVATRCILQSIFLVVIGLIAVIEAVLMTIQNKLSPTLMIIFVIQGILFIGMGVAFYPPSANFKRVATTKGSDIKELMEGLRKLNFGFKLLIIIILGSIAIDFLVILVS